MIVLAGQNGPFGVPVQQIAGNQEKAHRHRTDIAVGTPKQVLELIVAPEKETMTTINQYHVIVIPIIIVNSSANGKSGVIGALVIQTVKKVSSWDEGLIMKNKAHLVIQMIPVLKVKFVLIIQINVKPATIFTINVIESQLRFVPISDLNQRYTFKLIDWLSKGVIIYKDFLLKISAEQTLQ